MLHRMGWKHFKTGQVKGQKVTSFEFSTRMFWIISSWWWSSTWIRSEGLVQSGKTSLKSFFCFILSLVESATIWRWCTYWKVYNIIGINEYMSMCINIYITTTFIYIVVWFTLKGLEYFSGTLPGATSPGKSGKVSLSKLSLARMD